MQKQRNLPLALLLLAILLVYANSFNNGFHFDDFHTITDNPAVRSLGNLRRMFADTTAFSVLPANQTYRPVVTASLALDYALGHGYVPFWFHLSTMLWFLILVVLLFQFALVLFNAVEFSAENRHYALGVAAWFGLHPAMAETVNYVIQRGDLYCTLGCVAALLIFAELPSWRRWGLYLVPFVLAMLAKPPAAVFPLLLMLYVFFFEDPQRSLGLRWRKSLVSAFPATVATVVLLRLQAVMTPRTFAPSILSASAYRLTQPYVWLRYFTTLFLPLHLNVDTDLNAFEHLNGYAWAGLLFLLVLFAAILISVRRRKLYPIAFGLLWFLITQLPTSLYALSEVENDHRMFFSFPGLMIAMVWCLRLAVGRLSTVQKRCSVQPTTISRWIAGTAVLLLCGYAYGAHRRNAVWHSEASLWADDVAKSPRNGRGLMIYGLTRLNVGDNQGALNLFRRALVYTPNYPTLEINLGVVYGVLADSGQPSYTAQAENHFLRAIALAPNDDLPHAYYGRWLLQHGRLAVALPQLETAVALNGQRPMQRDLLLQAYAQEGNASAARQLAQSTLTAVPGDAAALAVLHGEPQAGQPSQISFLINASLQAYREGRFQQCIQQAEAALRVDEHSAQAWNNLGAGYGGLHQWDKGIAAEERALQIDPGLTIAANNLRWFRSQEAADQHGTSTMPGPGTKNPGDYINESLLLSQQGRHAESVAAARRALALDPGSAEAWNNVAAGEEAQGHWDVAIDAAQHAVALRPDFQLARNNLAWALQERAMARRH